VKNIVVQAFPPSREGLQDSSQSRSSRFPFRYQLLFVTPVTSPSSASLRKHSRHNANLRM
jgi:hypothetical protein